MFIEVTDAYLADRAVMLAWQLKGNAQDAQTLFELSSRDEEWVYQDFATARTITVAPRDPGPFVKRRSVLFGGEDGDILTGGSGADRLYGGGGADILDGGEGADYQEGNAGADELRGGEGGDLLRGGAGADLLQGGKGADRLEGGEGSDHYLYASGDGWDVIADSDGLGRVFYDGQALAGGEQVGGRRPSGCWGGVAGRLDAGGIDHRSPIYGLMKFNFSLSTLSSPTA